MQREDFYVRSVTSSCRSPAKTLFDGSRRFEEYSSSRSTISTRELHIRSNLGPSMYNSIDSFITPMQRISSPVIYRESRSKHSKTIIPESPAVGSYNIGVDFGKEIGRRGLGNSASFQSSGRSSTLLTDSEHYETLRERVKLSNLGPGSYNASPSLRGQSLTSPTFSDLKYRKNRIKDLSHTLADTNFPSSSSASSLSLSSSLGAHSRPHTSAGTGTGTGGKSISGKGRYIQVVVKVECPPPTLEELQAIANLPDYE